MQSSCRVRATSGKMRTPSISLAGSTRSRSPSLAPAAAPVEVMNNIPSWETSVKPFDAYPEDQRQLARVEEADVTYLLGNEVWSPKKMIENLTGEGLYKAGDDGIFICGLPSERKHVIFYLQLLLAKRRGLFFIHSKERVNPEFMSIVAVPEELRDLFERPSEPGAYSVLSEVEQTFGGMCLVSDDPAKVGSAPAELPSLFHPLSATPDYLGPRSVAVTSNSKMFYVAIINSKERKRAAAELKVRRVIESNIPGFFSSTFTESLSLDVGFAVDCFKPRSVIPGTPSYAIRHAEEVRSLCGSASGSTIEMVGDWVLVMGSGAERERGRAYVQLVERQRKLRDLIPEAIRDWGSASFVFLPTAEATDIITTLNKGFLEALERDFGLLVIIHRSKFNGNALGLFSGDTSMRRKAIQRIMDLYNSHYKQTRGNVEVCMNPVNTTADLVAVRSSSHGGAGRRSNVIWVNVLNNTVGREPMRFEGDVGFADGFSNFSSKMAKSASNTPKPSPAQQQSISTSNNNSGRRGVPASWGAQDASRARDSGRSRGRHSGGSAGSAGYRDRSVSPPSYRAGSPKAGRDSRAVRDSRDGGASSFARSPVAESGRWRDRPSQQQRERSRSRGRDSAGRDSGRYRQRSRSVSPPPQQASAPVYGGRSTVHSGLYGSPAPIDAGGKEDGEI